MSEIIAFFSGLTIGLLLFLWQYSSRHSLEKVEYFLRKEVGGLQQQLEQEHKGTLRFVEKISQLETTNHHLLTKIKDTEQEANVVQEQLLVQFKNISNELLTQKSDQFSTKNQQQMSLLLSPLKEKITDFQKQITHTQQVASERNIMLKQAFEKVNGLYEKMREEASKTTQAIMGDNKLQGTWGEVHALHLLERTGLKKNEQYFIQKGFSSANGKRYIPDFVIKLPGNRYIIMDIKVSMIDYIKYYNANNEKERGIYLKKHIQSIKNHIKNLGEKNYAHLYQLDGLDFVLLLLPIEPAFSLAIQHEPSLFEEAYTKNIVLVSPTTLQATLSMIEHIWRDNTRNRYALQIAQESGALYDKFVGFTESLKKVSAQLQGSQKACAEAMKRLIDGKGNLVSRAERLKKLGARTTKNLAMGDGDIKELSMD